MTKAYKTYSKKATPQSMPVPGREAEQVVNSAGGYVFAVNDWDRLTRFLILGSEGGTYYVNALNLTRDNAAVVERLIAQDGVRVVDRIVDISTSGRAPRNTPALFALALAAALGDEKTKRVAYQVLPRVARTGTHLLNWAQFCDQLRGTGSGWQKAVGRWFNDKSPQDVAFQTVKYQQREGWAMSDLLRLAHVKPIDQAHDNIYKWVVDGWSWNALDDYAEETVKPVPDLIYAFERAKSERDTRTLVRLVNDFRLPWEALPTEALRSPEIWEALLYGKALPLEATMRNLGRMTNIGLIKPMSNAAKYVASMFEQDYILKSRLHPLKILVGLKTYSQGKGMRGSLTWAPVREVIDALDGAFYLAFGNVTPTGKPTLLALDVSGSMTSQLAGFPISCREATAALALVTANVEPNYEVVGFASSVGWWGGSVEKSREIYPGLISLPISPRQRLDDVIKSIDGLPYSGTDCALPFLYASAKDKRFEAFEVITDNETWAGGIHPFQALQDYRQKFDIAARSAIVGMTATGFSIADPSDPGMLDVVGFDTATPQLIADFFSGAI